jgi:phosphoheptose isomerase
MKEESLACWAYFLASLALLFSSSVTFWANFAAYFLAFSREFWALAAEESLVGAITAGGEEDDVVEEASDLCMFW